MTTKGNYLADEISKKASQSICNCIRRNEKKVAIKNLIDAFKVFSCGRWKERESAKAKLQCNLMNTTVSPARKHENSKNILQLHQLASTILH